MRRSALLLALVSLSATVSAQTFFQYVSEPHDFVGVGQSGLITPADGTFGANNAFAGTVQVFFEGAPGSFWTFQFNNGFGTALQPGLYQNARRWPFNPVGTPGLAAFGNGNGCNTLTGRFLISEVVLNGDQVVSFAADFEQHCEGFGPALIGAIRYNSAAPTLIARLQNASSTPESFTFVSERGAINGGTSGVITNLTNGPFTMFANDQTGYVQVWLQPSPGSWRLEFESNVAGLLAVGDYPGAQPLEANPPGVPGIRVGGQAGGCASVGAFTVAEAQFDGGGGVRRLALDFEQHCQGQTPAVFGSLRINSLVPPGLHEMMGFTFASTFCAGEKCPCGNDNEFGGCASALGRGASLTTGRGGPSLSADDLELIALGLPPHVPVLLLAGRGLQRVPFGNGLSCLAGSQARPVVAPSDAGGTARWTHVARTAGAMLQASTPGPVAPVRFQAWYRDELGACGASANLSNGLQVSFRP